MPPMPMSAGKCPLSVPSKCWPSAHRMHTLDHLILMQKSSNMQSNCPGFGAIGAQGGDSMSAPGGHSAGTRWDWWCMLPAGLVV